MFSEIIIISTIITKPLFTVLQNREQIAIISYYSFFIFSQAVLYRFLRNSVAGLSPCTFTFLDISWTSPKRSVISVL